MNWLGGIGGVATASLTSLWFLTPDRLWFCGSHLWDLLPSLPTLAQLMPTLALRAWGHLWTTHLAPRKPIFSCLEGGDRRMGNGLRSGQGLIRNRQISGRDQTKYQGMRNLGFSLGERQALQLQSRPSVLQWSKNPQIPRPDIL